MRNLQFTSTAQVFLDKLERRDLVLFNQISTRIEKLQADPEAQGVKKLSSYQFYRARVRDFRIIYEFNDEEMRVIIIGHRNNVYRNLKLLMKNIRQFKPL